MKLHRIASGKVAIVPRELVAYEIAALLPEQNTALRIEFARFFRARCKRALELRCSEVGLRFDWERMFREPGLPRRPGPAAARQFRHSRRIPPETAPRRPAAGKCRLLCAAAPRPAVSRASRFRSNARRERRTGRRFTVSAFTVTFSRFTPSPKPGADGALTISEPSSKRRRPCGPPPPHRDRDRRHPVRRGARRGVQPSGRS